MNKIKKSKFLHVISFTLLGFLAFILFCFFYAKILLNKKSEELAYKEHTIYKEIITDDLVFKYRLYKNRELVESWYKEKSSETFNSEVFDNYKNDYFMIEENKLLKNSTSSEMLMVFQLEEYIGYAKASDYFKGLLDSHGQSYFIIKNSGEIIGQATTNYTNISSILDVDAFKWFDKNSSQPNAILRTNIFGKESYISSLELLPNVYMVQVSETSNYKLDLNALRYQFLVFSCLIILAFSFYIIIIYRAYTKKEIENRVYELNTENSDALIITVDKAGNIIKKQDKLKDKLKDITHILKLPNITLKKIKDLNKKTFFTAQIDKDIYRFTSIPYKKRYILIGESTKKISEDFENYKELAYLDIYTKIPNLLALRHYVSSIKLTQIDAGLLIDIKDFRKFKKIYGIDVSNEIVLNVYEAIKETFSLDKVKIFNIKTDTFVIVFETNKTNPLVLQEKIHKIITRYQYPITIDKTVVSVRLKAALMINDYHLKALSPEKVFELLNLTLNKAKKSNIYDLVIYDEELNHFLTQEEMMRKDLEKAVKKDEFMIYLQPQLSVKKNKIEAYEALLRWNHEKYIKTSPSKYIQMAEEDMLIHEIGNIVFDKTLSIMKDNEKINVALNVSPKQFLEPGFINSITSKINKYQVLPQNVAIEITETVLVESFEIVINKLKLLKELGFRIHLDDFGTGYSSLKYVKDLPLDALKIDKQFINDIVSDEKARTIVETFVELGHKLKLIVIAEGVETEEQASILEQLGCDYLQGYLIGKPEPFLKALTNDFKRKKKGK